MLIMKCLLAMLMIMLVILVLLDLNTDYADTDADFRIEIISFFCKRIVSVILHIFNNVIEILHLHYLHVSLNTHILHTHPLQ